MKAVFLCDAIRTPIGRYGGALSSVRTDDLAAIPIRALRERYGNADWSVVDDVILGCANQAGEDNRNVARMASLLAGMPVTVPGVTVNRLCGSGMEAVAMAARSIATGEADMVIAGGVESMSRAPYVMSKSATPFARDAQMFDTTIGWRFVNAALRAQYGIDSMPETAENVAAEHRISRQDQDAFSLRSQQRAVAAQRSGRFDVEICSVPVAAAKGVVSNVTRDEHPRETDLAALAKLSTPFRDGGTVTAGNSSGINDGACAVLLADERSAVRHGLTPRARILGAAVAGVEPRVMGLGPVPAVQKLLARTGVDLRAIGIIELNEAFAAQALAVLRTLGIDDDAEHVNRNGGAIALGHPLGASGARLVTTSMHQMNITGERYALCSLCVGVGQGIAMLIERV